MRAIKISVEGDVFEIDSTLDVLFDGDQWFWKYAEIFSDYGYSQGLPVFVYETYDRVTRRMIHNPLATSLNEDRTLYGDVYLFNRDSVGSWAEIVSLQDDITIAVVREALENARRANR